MLFKVYGNVSTPIFSTLCIFLELVRKRIEMKTYYITTDVSRKLGFVRCVFSMTVCEQGRSKSGSNGANKQGPASNEAS